MEVDCPFCPYADHDYRYVIEHVECCHPEFGDSPFIVKNDAGVPPLAKGKDLDRADTSNAPSEEEYMECECGEVVMLSEFTSHSALHDMEQTTANLADPTILHSLNSPNPNIEDTTLNPVSDNSFYESDHSVPRSAIRHHPLAGHHKNHHTIQDFMSVLLGSRSSHSLTMVARTRSKAPRRLGVGTKFILISKFANPRCRKLSWVHMLMKTKCPHGFENNSR